MQTPPFDPDELTILRKTVTETDMILFAGITGDFAKNHTDEEYMSRTPYGRRHIHGALVVGFMSAVAAKALERARPEGFTPVSLGYDRIRFTRPVYPGETLEVRYQFNEYDPQRLRAVANVEAFVGNEMAAVGSHAVKWVTADADVAQPVGAGPVI